MNSSIINKLAQQGSGNRRIDQASAIALYVGMVGVEKLTHATFSPLISMVCFIFFAHRMSPKWVGFWVVIFSVSSLLFLLDGHPLDSVTALIRFATLLAGGIGAALISSERVRMKESFVQTIQTLEKLPMPVIVSDHEGFVVFMNHDALQLLDVAADQVYGSSYFSFVAGEQKGQTIQRYFEFIDSHEKILQGVVIQIKRPRIKARAIIAAIDGQSTKLLATVFSLNTANVDIASAEALVSA